MKSKIKLRHTNVCAVYLILKQNDKLLFGKRANTGYMDSFFGLPAGHCEPGESLMQAIIREAQEEIGITLSASDLSFSFLLHRYCNDNPSPQVERVDVFFECTTWQGKIINNEPEKCTGLSWFKQNELPTNTVPYIKYALDQIAQGLSYSELNWPTQIKDRQAPAQTPQFPA